MKRCLLNSPIIISRNFTSAKREGALQSQNFNGARESGREITIAVFMHRLVRLQPRAPIGAPQFVLNFMELLPQLVFDLRTLVTFIKAHIFNFLQYDKQKNSYYKLDESRFKFKSDNNTFSRIFTHQILDTYFSCYSRVLRSQDITQIMKLRITREYCVEIFM